MASLLKKNDVIQLRIDSLGSEAQGIGRHEDFVIFVPFALPAEVVRVQILSVKKSFAYGKLLEVVTPSVNRVTPPCPHYGKCGGCSTQHMDYPTSLRFKQDEVENNMRRIAKSDIAVEETLGMDNPWNYRNKMAMPVQDAFGVPVSGFYAPRSHRIVPIEECFLSIPPDILLKEIVLAWMRQHAVSAYDEQSGKGLIRHIVSRVNRQGESILLLIINGKRVPNQDALIEMLIKQVPKLVGISYCVNTSRGNTILGPDYQVIWGERYLQESLLGLRFRISPLSFFQVNPVMTEVLYSTAISISGAKPDETMLDIYCGAGTISLCFASHVKQVIGIEIVPQAIEDAKNNALANNIHNAEFIQGKAEVELPKLIAQGFNPDLVMLDPPRKGADQEVLDALIQAETNKIIYISCHPATQARDARYLLDNGYRIERCCPVDMFCQTAGIENILLFHRM